MTIGISYDRLIKRIVSVQFHPVIAKIFFNKWRRQFVGREFPTHTLRQVLDFWQKIVNMPFTEKDTRQTAETWDLLANQIIDSVADDDRNGHLKELYSQMRNRHTHSNMMDNGLCKENHGGVIMTLFGYQEKQLWDQVQALIGDRKRSSKYTGKTDAFQVGDFGNMTFYYNDPDMSTESVNVDGSFVESLSEGRQQDYIDLLIAEAQPQPDHNIINKWLAQVFIVGDTNAGFNAAEMLSKLAHHPPNPREYIAGRYHWNVSANTVAVMKEIHNDRRPTIELKKRSQTSGGYVMSEQQPPAEGGGPEEGKDNSFFILGGAALASLLLISKAPPSPQLKFLVS